MRLETSPECQVNLIPRQGDGGPRLCFRRTFSEPSSDQLSKGSYFQSLIGRNLMASGNVGEFLRRVPIFEMLPPLAANNGL